MLLLFIWTVEMPSKTPVSLTDLPPFFFAARGKYQGYDSPLTPLDYLVCDWVLFVADDQFIDASFMIRNLLYDRLRAHSTASEPEDPSILPRFRLDKTLYV